MEHNGLKVNAISAGAYVVFFGLDLAEGQRPGFLGFGFKRHDHVEGDTTWLRGKRRSRKPSRIRPGARRFRPTTIRFNRFNGRITASSRAAITRIKLSRCTVCRPISRRRIEARGSGLDGGRNRPESFGILQSRLGVDAGIRSAVPERHARPGRSGRIHLAVSWVAGSIGCFLGGGGRGLVNPWRSLRVPTAGGAGCGEERPGARRRGEGAVRRHRKVRKTGNRLGRGGQSGGDQKRQDQIAVPRPLERRNYAQEILRAEPDGRTEAVWTGSTNLTVNGVYGHSNLGHIVEDEAVAQAYREYWDRLEKIPRLKINTGREIVATPAPPDPWEATRPRCFRRGEGSGLAEWYVRSRAGQGGAVHDLCVRDAREVSGRCTGRTIRFCVWRCSTGSGAIQKHRSRMKGHSGDPESSERGAGDRQPDRDRQFRPLAGGVVGQRSSGPRLLDSYQVHARLPVRRHPGTRDRQRQLQRGQHREERREYAGGPGDKRIADIYFGEFLRLYSHYPSVKQFSGT